MRIINKDSFYMNEVSLLSKEMEDYQSYSILPKYGSGKFIVYSIIPGLCISHNKFYLNNKIINKKPKFSKFYKPLLKIDYCIKGKMLAYNELGKVCISNNGSTAYFIGEDNIQGVEHFGKQYESITIFGYADDILDTLKNIFGLDRDKFQLFLEEIDDDSDFIVIKSNPTVVRLINEIWESLNRYDSDKLKLKVIELLLYEIRNIGQNKTSIEQYYSKSTVDKVVAVEQHLVTNIDKKITVNELCIEFKLTLDTLKKCFKQIYKDSVYSYIKKKRMYRGKELLENSSKSITEIALSCGYSNHHSFGKAFKQTFKVPPREIRKASLR